MSDALKALLEKHGKRLRVLIELHCGRDQGLDPDDIEQEVRIKLWKALESDKNLIAAASYIQKVVVTTVVDAVRRAQVRHAESIEDKDEAGFDPSVSSPLRPEAQAGRGQWSDLLLRCIGELPERRRLPVQLALQGFTADEVARMTGASVTAAQQLCYRGIEELKARLRELGADDIED